MCSVFRVLVDTMPVASGDVRHILAAFLSAERATDASRKDCRAEPNPMIDMLLYHGPHVYVCPPYKC